jgi:hypothetical protein
MSCDVFIFLDDVQIQKTAGSWTNRVGILHEGNKKWLSIPIKRRAESLIINKIEFAEPDWKHACMAKIDAAYRKSPYYREVMSFLSEIFEDSFDFLAEFNQVATIKILQYLEVKLPIMVNASDYGLKSTSTDRILDLIKQVDGDEYLCGGGSDSYLEREKFSEANVTLTMQNFMIKSYQQRKTEEFIHGLSVIDPLMMIGPENTKKLLTN